MRAKVTEREVEAGPCALHRAHVPTGSGVSPRDDLPCPPALLYSSTHLPIYPSTHLPIYPPIHLSTQCIEVCVRRAAACLLRGSTSLAILTMALFTLALLTLALLTMALLTLALLTRAMLTPALLTLALLTMALLTLALLTRALLTLAIPPRASAAGSRDPASPRAHVR